MHLGRDVEVRDEQSFLTPYRSLRKQPIEKAWRRRYGGTHRTTVGDIQSSYHHQQKNPQGITQCESSGLKSMRLSRPIAAKFQGLNHSHLVIFKKLMVCLTGFAPITMCATVQTASGFMLMLIFAHNER
jgi:hypothetical protein